MNLIKDIYLSMNGVDVEAIKKIEREKREKEKAEKLILSTKSKHFLQVFGLLIILVYFIELYIYISSYNLWGIIRCIFLIGVGLAVEITLSIKGHVTEVLSLLGIVVVIVLTFLI